MKQLAASNPIFSNQYVEVDLTLVFDVSADDKNYIRLMVDTFRKTFPATIQRIQNALANRDWDQLYKAAHFSKSSLSIIKVTGMLQAAKEIEAAAKHQQDAEYISRQLDELKERFRQADELLGKQFVDEPA